MNFFMFVLFMLVSSQQSFAMGDKSLIEKQSQEAGGTGSNSCNIDDKVIVEIGGLQLEINRSNGISVNYGPEFFLNEPNESYDYDCSDKFIKNVTFVAIFSAGKIFKIILPRQGWDFKTYYKSRLRYINQANKEKKVQVLIDGTEKIVSYGIFILPKDKAATFDGEPVVLQCASGGCSTSYVHPTGLYFSYQVTTGKNAQDLGDDVVGLDRSARRVFEDKIIKNK